MPHIQQMKCYTKHYLYILNIHFYLWRKIKHHCSLWIQQIHWFNRVSYLRMLLTNFRFLWGFLNLCCFQTIFPVKMRIFQLIIVRSRQQAKTYQHQDLEATDKSKGSKSSKGFHHLTQTTCAWQSYLPAYSWVRNL